MMRRDAMRRRLAVALPLAAAGLLLLAALQFVQLRTDMIAFLPEGRTPAARLVLEEARSGAATGLILLGIEGAAPAELARISRAIVAALPATGLFSLVAGGPADVPEAEEAALFARRYLLSPASTATAFTVPALQADLARLLRQLGGTGAPLAVHYGLADPPGAFLALLRGMVGDNALPSLGGAWLAPGQDRALLLARTRAGGMDVPAQETATAAIGAAFAAAEPSTARLLIAGPAVFARDAARSIRGDVQRISIVSTALVVLLLWWRFRAPLVLAVIAVPLLASIAAALLAVQLVFGQVHGVAMGFGITMLGVSVDYPVLLIGHRKTGEPAPATRARIASAFILAVVSAILGLAAMVFSGFPGLAQLGVFSAVGLAVAALVTWWVLPRLVVAAELAPVSAGDPRWLARVERLRRWRLAALLPVAAAALWLGVRGGPDWQDDLASLSPVPAASRALDRELRAQLGAPEVGHLLILRGPDAETVLRRQEALLPVLDRLRAAGLLTGAVMAAQLLPSIATQDARRAALPAPDALALRLEQARTGMAFRPGAFQPFIDAVAASRAMPPLRPDDLAGTALGTRLEPLLFQRGEQWQGPVALQGLRPGTDPAALAAALGGTEGAIYVDMRAELGGVLAGYSAGAWRWLGWSGLLVLLALGLGLRDPWRVLRVLTAVAAALLVTIGLLTLGGVALSLIHLVALQLVAGVGLDYALFFARPRLDAEERARTLRTLVTCNGMTLLTFGLLAASQTPVLRDIGVAVALGALLAMVYGFLWAGAAPAPAHAKGKV